MRARDLFCSIHYFITQISIFLFLFLFVKETEMFYLLPKSPRKGYWKLIEVVDSYRAAPKMVEIPELHFSTPWHVRYSRQPPTDRGPFRLRRERWGGCGRHRRVCHCRGGPCGAAALGRNHRCCSVDRPPPPAGTCEDCGTLNDPVPKRRRWYRPLYREPQGRKCLLVKFLVEILILNHN